MKPGPQQLVVTIVTLLLGVAVGVSASGLLSRRAGPATPVAPAFAAAGKPIHPAIVQSLMCPLSASRPFFRAVDITAFDEAESYELTEGAGTMTASHLDDAHARTGEYIAYRHIGVLPSGVHVLDVFECGGGSGVFRTLLLVRLAEVPQDSLIKNRQPSLLMSSVDQIALGDRNDAEVSVEGDSIVVDGKLEGELAGSGDAKARLFLKLR